MNLKSKVMLMACLLLAALLVLGGCAAEKTPYQVNDGEQYTVSVKYDANGGTFTTNTSVIVDSYNIAEMTPGSDGQVGIALLPPDDKHRGNDAFTAVKNGYFLAGWYTQRTESGVDSEGNPVYTYAGKWDFSKDLVKVAANGTYTSEEPVVTLYAAWVPRFEIQFYSLEDTETPFGSYTFDPDKSESIRVPAWDPETGAMEMYDFPKRTGYTFHKVYYDAAGAQAVDADTITHPGVVDYTTGTAENVLLKLYVEWTKGEWYHIYNVDQFLDNASVNGNYVLHADLDFADKIWPTSLMYGNFSGSIQGNGHTLRNISLTQTNNSKVNAGLFGHLTETAKLTDLTLDNVTFTIKSGTRVAGTGYGLLTGSLSSDAQLQNVQVKNSRLQIDSGCYFGVDDYAIGLLCGMGDPSAVDLSGITCTVVGNDPDRVQAVVSGNTVTLEFVR